MCVSSFKGAPALPHGRAGQLPVHQFRGGGGGWVGVCVCVGGGGVDTVRMGRGGMHLLVEHPAQASPRGRSVQWAGLPAGRANAFKDVGGGDDGASGAQDAVPQINGEPE